MKQKFGIVLLLAFSFLACGSISSFETPNQLRNLAATVYLTNGRSVDGRLTVQVGNVFGSDVKLVPDGDKEAMRFTLSDVQGYRLRNDYFALKEKRGGFGVGRRLAFMKRLTPEESRIHLFEDRERVTESTKANGASTSRTRYETEYYLQLPNEAHNQVYPLGGSRFVPNFDEKMSALLSDCPSLAAKIAAKESGYFYAQVSLFREKRLEVLLNIIREYNRCPTEKSR